MSLYKNIIREPVRVLVDIYYFQLTAYKKPVSFIFNYILPYQSLRIKIDAFLTKIYQTKFMKLEKDNSKKNHLEKMYEDGVINIDNFYNFENTELLIELIDNHNQKELDKIINKTKQEVWIS